MIKVSIIVPVYNTAQYLPKCLDSLLSQTLQDIEIICINDGSTDNSAEILKLYASKDQRIKVIDQQNKGPGKSRNVGICAAAGQYLGFVDSDDYVNAKYFEALYKAAQLNHADIAATRNVFYKNNQTCSHKNMGIPAKSEILDTIDEKGATIIASGVSCNKIYSKEFLNNNNIKYWETRTIGEDNYFVELACIFANKIAVCDQAIYYYRQHDASIIHTAREERDFSVCDVYKAILDKIADSNLSEQDKCLWKNIICARIRIDCLQNIAPTFKPNLQKDFVSKVKSIVPPLIISLTSYPARIQMVHLTIESLLKQTVCADNVILWLAPEQFPNKEADLPKELLAITKRGLTIEWYHDIKSYKKLIPALKMYPDAIIITADDDIIYDDNWLELLLNSNLKNPNSIICHRAHRIRFLKQNVAPYKDWDWDIKNIEPSYNNFFTGCGGVLYPPKCLCPDVVKEQLFSKLAPHGDDIWFWAMAVINNTKICVTPGKKFQQNTIPLSQDSALWLNNVNECHNDKQIKQVIEAYPEIITKLDKILVYHNYCTKYSIPLIEIKSTQGTFRMSLFGIQIIKIKHSLNSTKYYLFGVQIWRRKK